MKRSLAALVLVSSAFVFAPVANANPACDADLAWQQRHNAAYQPHPSQQEMQRYNAEARAIDAAIARDCH